MTTVHFVNAYHEDSGGIRVHYGALLAAANRAGRRMCLVTPGHRESAEAVGDHGIVYRVPAPLAALGDRRYRTILPTAFLGHHSPVQRILRAEQPDLVEVCDKYSLCHVAGLIRVGRMRGLARPTLVGLSAERFDDTLASFVSASEPTRAFARWYVRTVYAQPFDFHLANSEYTADELRAALPSHRQRVLAVRPPGADVRAFEGARAQGDRRRAVRARLGARDQDRLLLYAGRLSREKRVHLLVDIVARLAGDAARRWLLVVAGDGPEGRALRADASSRVPGRVLFVGNLRDRAALADLHAGCDAFVHTNPAEPFGIAPLEAMASGLPLVAPRAGGVLSYACDATAWLTDGSARDFAKTLRMMVDIPGAVALRAVAGRARAPQWDSALMAQRLFETYDDWHRERQELQRQAPSALHAVADGPHGANGPTAGEVSP